ncbi:hypothetical protein ACLOJK_041501, partial [Asimina triloba]
MAPPAAVLAAWRYRATNSHWCSDNTLPGIQGPPSVDTEPQPLKTICTIHGGAMQGGRSMTQHCSYAREVLHLHSPVDKRRKQGVTLIFMDDNAVNIRYPHNDSLVISALFNNITIRRV